MKAKKRPRRPSGDASRAPSPSERIRRSYRPEPAFIPRIHPRLRSILEEIGKPEARPFQPDPYQLEALTKLDQGDVIVSAPTGAGKTYIAVEAMAGLLDQGKRSWYASPLKALSNSKFLEFGQRFGADRVGLLTGDHKVNPDAPLIVGTTEILRNQLYDAMHRGRDLDVDLVVMDEAHYLADPDRGVVWEEVIIYLPTRIKLLLLSATVDNAREIADWLALVRGHPASVVWSDERPVPLKPLFLFPDGELAPLSKGNRLFPKVGHFVQQDRSRPRRSMKQGAPIGRTLKALGRADLLPAIFFLKSRADCDQALTRCLGSTDHLQPGQLDRLTARLDQLLDQYPFLKTHPHLQYLRLAGVAAHHAGHLPHWKMVIERLMQEGLLAAIFSTSTVAAGVNFPARTVVISQSDRFNGREFADLTATDLLQMTGRAGRRGMDRIGFAVIVPGPYLNTGLIHALFRAAPEPIQSQIQINFSMALNLLLSHRPEEIKPLLKLSLAAFQQGQIDPVASEQLSRLSERVRRLTAGGLCRNPEEALTFFEDEHRLQAEAQRLVKQEPGLIQGSFYRSALIPGRLFVRKDGATFCAVERQDRQDRQGVLAVLVKRDRLLKNGRLKVKWIPFDRIIMIYDKVVPLESVSNPKEAAGLIRDQAGETHAPFQYDGDEPQPPDEALVRWERRKHEVDAELDRLPCQTCSLAERCIGNKKSEACRALRNLLKIRAQVERSSRLLWSDFIRHLQFLQDEGFVQDGELTDDGLWASQLRVDHPLVIAAAIKARAWPRNRSGPAGRNDRALCPGQGTPIGSQDRSQDPASAPDRGLAAAGKSVRSPGAPADRPRVFHSDHESQGGPGHV